MRSKLSRTAPLVETFAAMLTIGSGWLSLTWVGKTSQPGYIIGMVYLTVAAVFGLLAIWRWRYSAFTPSDRDLAEEALEIGNRMREVEARYHGLGEQEMVRTRLRLVQVRQAGNDEAERHRLYEEERATTDQLRTAQHSEYGRNLAGRAIWLRDEMRRRLNAPMDDRYRDTARTFDGEGGGPYPLNAAANYLQLLAHELLARWHDYT
jgi:hypothetical protein